MPPARCPLAALPLAVVGAMALGSAGCSRAESVPHVSAAAAPLAARPAPAATPASAHVPAAARSRLVFFMNPAGRPCQLQDQVLREMSAELGRTVDVVYFKTTEAGDLARFQEYGIRALPQLLVTDAGGRELRRATPGILGPEQVRSLLAN
jgi:thioredoxin 1